VVEALAERNQLDVKDLIGNRPFLSTVNPRECVSERAGELTVRDILTELDKPGRDPRPEFKTASYAEGVETLEDLKPGMTLEGAVTNITNFGAFVDIGVHQDGLVHISALSHKFVKDPREVVKTGALVKVKVLDIDIGRRRIALTMRLDDEPVRTAGKQAASAHTSKGPESEKPDRVAKRAEKN
jgi:uncharacterized protein